MCTNSENAIPIDFLISRQGLAVIHSKYIQHVSKIYFIEHSYYTSLRCKLDIL